MRVTRICLAMKMKTLSKACCTRSCISTLLIWSSDHTASPKRRKLDDEALDSGDEEGRYDRLDEDGIDGYGDEEDGAQEARQRTIMDVNLSRHPVPEPSDGEVCNLHNLNLIGEGDHVAHDIVALPVFSPQTYWYRTEAIPPSNVPTPGYRSPLRSRFKYLLRCSNLQQYRSLALLTQKSFRDPIQRPRSPLVRRLTNPTNRFQRS